MTAVLLITAAAFVLIAFGLALRQHGDRIIDEILAAEVRQIDRERKAREVDANLKARWQG